MFSERLKELRIRKNLTQEELANEIFVSRAAISKWERGKGIPSEANLEQLCSFFQIEDKYLLCQEDFEIEFKNRNNIKKIVMFLPLCLLSFVFLLLSAIKFFHFLRVGPYQEFTGYFPNLSIFIILQEFSIIPAIIYISIFFFSVLFYLNIIKNISYLKYFLCLSYLLITTTFVISFLISCFLIFPYNYGIFQKL